MARIAERLGATPATDAFLTAFLIPESLYVFLTEGALTTAFVPPFTRALARGARSFLSLFATTAGLMALFSGAIALIFWKIAPLLVWTIAPGFDGETSRLTADLLSVVVGYIPLTCVATILFAGLYARQHFLTPALGPLVFNLAVIASVGYASPQNVRPLAWGVLAGGLLQLALQILPLVRSLRLGQDEDAPRPIDAVGHTPPPSETRPPTKLLDLSHPGLKETLWLLFPLTLSLGITQVQLLAERYIASGLPRGTITSLNLIGKLVNLPLGLIGLAVTVPLVPALTKLDMRKDSTEFARTLEQGLVWLTALIAPITALCLIEPDAIVRILFQRGAFGLKESSDAATLLWYYALGLPAVSACYLLTSAFLATGDALSPALIRATVLTGNIGLNFHYLSSWGLATIPLCFTLMYVANTTALLLLIGRRTPTFRPGRIVGLVLFTVVITVASGLLARQSLVTWLPEGSTRLVELSRVALLGGMVAAISIFITVSSRALRRGE